MTDTTFGEYGYRLVYVQAALRVPAHWSNEEVTEVCRLAMIDEMGEFTMEYGYVVHSRLIELALDSEMEFWDGSESRE